VPREGEPEASTVAPAAAAPEPSPGFLAKASAGYREILGSRDLRTLVGLYCGQTVVAGASLVFTITVALQLLGIGRSGFGYLNATLGIGGAVGGFVALVLAQRANLARDFGIGVFLWSAPLLLTAVWPNIATAVIVMVLLGLVNSVVDVNGYTILQRIAPKEKMARIFGAMESAVIGTMALGALLMPFLINTIGLRWGLVVVGGASHLSCSSAPADCGGKTGSRWSRRASRCCGASRCSRSYPSRRSTGWQWCSSASRPSPATSSSGKGTKATASTSSSRARWR
jgi:hypothetical protein